METKTSATDNKGRARRAILRWLIRFAVAALVLVLLALSALWYASRHLVELARWGMSREFPNVILDLQSLEIASPRSIEVTRLVLKSRKDGATLLTLDKGIAVFQLDDLLRKRIGEIRLVNPHIAITPRLPEAFASSERGKGGPAPGSVWSISRLVCDYGDLDYSEFGKNIPVVRAKFACDLRNLSNGPDATRPQVLTLWGLTASAPGTDQTPFLSLDLVTIGFSLNALLENHEISSLTLKGGSFIFDSASGQFFTGRSSAPEPSASPAFKVGSLHIQGIGIQIRDPGLHPKTAGSAAGNITFQLNTKLQNVSPSEAASTVGNAEQHIEISDLEILSPLDPFVKVLTLRSVFLKFTFAELLQKKLRAVTVLSPTIYVGEDLFWYMDDAQKRLASQPGSGTGSGPGWVIDSFRVEYGELVIGSGGRSQYGIPLTFHSDARNVSVDNLAALRLNGALTIPGQSYSFPSYQIEVSTVAGTLQFAYPPERNQNNLVGTIFLDQIRWRQYKATTGWLTTTFDRSGINGRFGGHAYGGYVMGGFSFLFDSRSPWVGWVGGRSVDLKQLTDVVAPQSLQLTGPLDFHVQMDAFGKKIDRIRGGFQVKGPGHMKIGKLDELADKIPSGWSTLKKSVTQISLETLRDFDYTKAAGDCWFVLGQGILNLNLQGPAGSRNFEVVLHGDNSSYGQWKKAPIQH